MAIAPPFTIAFARRHPFGRLAGVWLPRDRPPRPAPDEVTARLAASEAAFARALTGFRHVEWIGGRLAARAAAGDLAATAWAVGVGARGEPLAPTGFSVSIAHKRHLAVALVVDAPDVEIGVDLESDADAAQAIEELVFSPEERASLDALSPAEQASARLVGFALKEATYKALSARLGPLGYRDAGIVVHGPGRATIALSPWVTPEPTPLDVAVEWEDGHVIAAVRARGRSRRGTPSSLAR
jgi:4'-phosphopantetheinyl transferase EntD